MGFLVILDDCPIHNCHRQGDKVYSWVCCGVNRDRGFFCYVFEEGAKRLRSVKT